MNTALKRWAGWLSLALAGLLLIGVIAEQIARARYNSRIPPPATFFDVAGRRIHFDRRGTGAPCVVFEAGLGADHVSWAPVQEAVTKLTSTVSYDRAGLLWSDRNPAIPSLAAINRDFEAMLAHSDCPKPYILVGHSLAGITLRPFIRDHAQDIAGVVFVDVAHPKMLDMASEQLKQLLVVPPEWLITALVGTGAFRAIYSFVPLVPDFPADHWYNQHARQSFFRSYQAILRLAEHDDPMFAESAAVDTFGDIPLTVITATYPQGNGIEDPELEREYRQLNRQLQADLLQLSSRSRQVMATRSGHYVPIQEPQLIVDAIREYLPAQPATE